MRGVAGCGKFGENLFHQGFPTGFSKKRVCDLKKPGVKRPNFNRIFCRGNHHLSQNFRGFFLLPCGEFRVSNLLSQRLIFSHRDFLAFPLFGLHYVYYLSYFSYFSYLSCLSCLSYLSYLSYLSCLSYLSYFPYTPTNHLFINESNYFLNFFCHLMMKMRKRTKLDMQNAPFQPPSLYLEFHALARPHRAVSLLYKRRSGCKKKNDDVICFNDNGKK